MRRGVLIVLAILALFAAGLAGFRLGQRQARSVPPATTAEVPRRPLFYRHPMNPRVTSPVPAKDEMGMDYVPVFAELETEPGAPTPPGNQAGGERKILHYRHPMGLPDTSPVPRKDEMGMDYLPVYEDEAALAGGVRITPEKIQKLGVVTEVVERRTLVHVIRAFGLAEVDERRIYAIAPRFGGWIERLAVNASGQLVRRGQVLFEVYSPEVIAAQEEYRIAAQSGGTRTLREGALARLRNWDLPNAWLRNLEATREIRQRAPLASPVDGIVLEKTALQGLRFMPGDTLFRIADLSTVWLIASVFEQDLAHVRQGQMAAVRFNAYPGRSFQGRVTFIHPALAEATRTARVRIELANPNGLIKPAMYGNVEIQADVTPRPVLAAPESAILDSGTRQVVLVQHAEGLFQPRAVEIGQRLEGYAEVLAGLREGERIVTRANFLIDAESNLKAALGSLSGGRVPEVGGEQPPEPSSAPPPHGSSPEHAGAH